MTSPRPNHYAKQWAQFQAEIKDHELTVIHEDGVYRHLRMAAPGTGMWHWDVITWPGRLVIVGDIADGYIFSRVHDMLTFFDHLRYDPMEDGSPHINPPYWAEKLSRGGRRSVLVWSSDLFLEALREHTEAVEKPVEPPFYPVENEHEAYEWLSDHEQLSDWDSWDSCREYDWHYIIACYAIVTTVKAYWEMKHA